MKESKIILKIRKLFDNKTQSKIRQKNKPSSKKDPLIKSATYTGILGETFEIRSSWTVFDKSIATKLNWYISDCTIKSLKNDDSEDGKKVKIIEDLCYAGVVNATPKSALVSNKEFT